MVESGRGFQSVGGLSADLARAPTVILTFNHNLKSSGCIQAREQDQEQDAPFLPIAQKIGWIGGTKDRDHAGVKIILYEMAHSPFCIPIAQLLQACGAPFERREVPNWDRSEIIRLTDGGYYQVPVLVHDQEVVYESGAESQDIARYVDRVWAGQRLFPEALTGPHQCVIDFLENEVEARTFKLVDPSYLESVSEVVARTMTIRHKERKFGRGCINEWRRNAATIRAEADALLHRFETTLRHSPFLFGSVPLYADFLLFGILGNLTFRHYNELSRAQPALVTWRDRLRDYRFA